MNPKIAYYILFITGSIGVIFSCLYMNYDHKDIALVIFFASGALIGISTYIRSKYLKKRV